MSVQLVSKEAGVSVATVSRVINHSRSVSPATVSAVQQAMAKIGYVPPPAEKRQRRRDTGKPQGVRNGNICLLFPDIDQRALRTALSGRFMHGVGEVLRARSVNMIVTPLASGWLAPPCIAEKQVDGVIVRGCAYAKELMPFVKDLPCVWLLDGELPESGDHVAEDNAWIGRLAVQHLKSRGCHRVAVINPQGLHYGYRARCDWFCIEGRRAGLEVKELIQQDAKEVSLLEAHLWEQTLANLVDQLVAMPTLPQGLFIPCPDDMITFIYRALEKKGVRPCVDIQLICCSYDPPRLATLDPRIDNIDILAEAMGRAAVETLLWRLRHANEPQRRVMVVPRLVEGRTAVTA